MTLKVFVTSVGAAIIGLTHQMQRAGATPEQADRLTKIDNAAVTNAFEFDAITN
jgi:hypothetical protein